jgi:hypothetical protein
MADYSTGKVELLKGEGYITDKTGKLLDPGVPIFLNLKIYRLEAQKESLVIAKESSEQRSEALGADHISKTILDSDGHWSLQNQNRKPKRRS